jgi:hypothetical protein
MKRVVVFIDAQNFYRNARRAFFDDANARTTSGSFGRASWDNCLSLAILTGASRMSAFTRVALTLTYSAQGPRRQRASVSAVGS